MSVYAYCKACKGRVETCAAPDSHRAASKIVWQCNFRLGGRYGRRIYETFKPGITKQEALKWERSQLADYDREKIDPGSGNKSKTSFVAFMEEYKKHVSRHMKGAEVEIYRLKHAERLWGDRPIYTIGIEEADKYINQRLDKGRSKTTVNRERTSLRLAFKWAKERNYITTNPFESIKEFNVDVIRERWLTESEIELMINGARTLKDFDLEDLIVVGINCGFRKANLAALEAKHFIGDRLHAELTKEGRPYDVPVNAVLKERLQKLVRMRGGKKLLNFRNIKRRWERLTKFVGLYKPNRDPNNVTLHTMRHTFVSQALVKGVPIDVACKWADHHSVEFTRKHYGHLCPNKEAEYSNQLNLGSNQTFKEVKEGSYEKQSY